MSKTPVWYRFTPFLGRPPELTKHQWKLLGLLSAVSFFENYDMYLFTLNLKQIQAELLIAESDLGLLGAIVNAGAFLAVFLAMAADRFGRRSLLLITIVGYTFFTAATALAPNTEAFVVFQMLARCFGTAELLIAAVVIAEEFAPENRGWGIGAMGAVAACGAGFASIMFGFVESVPYGWRSLYAIGVIPLLFIAYWRRVLPETQKFESVVQIREPVMKNVGDLFTRMPKRTIAFFVAVFGLILCSRSATFFAPKYLQDVQGWEPSSVALLSFAGGALAIVGNPLAGWLSDRFGRRPMTTLFTAMLPLAAFAFYSMTGVIAPILWIGLIFFHSGSEVVSTSYGTELFPTRYRSTGTGFRAIVGSAAGIIGLSMVSLLYPIFGSNWTAITVLCAISLITPLMVWLFLPETAGRRLEEIAPD